MAWAKPLIDAALGWLKDYAVENLQAVVNLDKSRAELVEKMKDLEAKKKDLERDVRQQESPDLARTSEVSLWLRRVEDLKTEVDQFKEDMGSTPGFPECCSPGALWCRCQLVATAPDLIRRTGGLVVDRSKLDPLVAKADWDPRRGMSDPPMIDAEDIMPEIRSCLQRGDKKIIGIYGMGGVGKTTLLKKIHYELRSLGQFDHLMWVELERKMEAALVRKTIGKYLGNSTPEALEADELRRYLAGKSFVLLLDNLWEELKLAELGLSDTDLGDERKIVFTTRLESVCVAMGAHRIKMNVLKPEKARGLFKMSVGREEIFDDSPILPFVEDVVSECGGLPLALKIVGGAMPSDDIDDWRDAAERLKESPGEIPEVEEKVFKVLKFSFDSLDENQKQCLLFCALFPEGHDIDRRQLAGYWMAEGLLDDQQHKDLKSRHRKARDVINRLKSSCLLDVGSNPQQAVRMHDVVRDVAVWIAAEKLLVHPRWGSSETDAQSWKDAVRLSITHSALKLPKKVPTCSSLSTLLIRRNSRILEVPPHLLSSMPNLRVLDFSGTKIDGLPTEVGGLKVLRYLNLSHTMITSLPEGLGNLEQLRHLDLSYTTRLTQIPNGVMSRLANLWTLNMFQCGYDAWVETDHPGARDERRRRGVSLRELEGLSQLQEFGLNITTREALEEFLRSTLLDSTTCLCLAAFLDFSPDAQSSVFDRVKQVQELHIGNFVRLRELRFGRVDKVEVLKLFDLPYAKMSWREVPDRRCPLRCLEISECHELTDLDWVEHFKSLETISLSNCSKLQQVMKSQGIDGERSTPVRLYRLKEMTLRSLPNLESVFGSSVESNSLASLTCRGCPKLKNFPFLTSKATKLVEIHGEQQWWNGLRWESEHQRSHFSPFFKQVVGE